MLTVQGLCRPLRPRAVDHCCVLDYSILVPKSCITGGTLIIFPLFLSWKVIYKIIFLKFFYICLPLKMLVNKKYFLVKEKFSLVFIKVFSWKIWTENTFRKLWKKLEISYYLLIISNLILKIFIAIYILFWIFIFQFHLLKFNFYINFNSYFYNFFLFLGKWFTRNYFPNFPVFVCH
jgi:hypothetical protein